MRLYSDPYSARYGAAGECYEVKASMVYLQGKSCVIHTRALQGFVYDGALYKLTYLYFYLSMVIMYRNVYINHLDYT